MDYRALWRLSVRNAARETIKCYPRHWNCMKERRDMFYRLIVKKYREYTNLD